jgi:hypothetical protein
MLKHLVLTPERAEVLLVLVAQVEESYLLLPKRSDLVLHLLQLEFGLLDLLDDS